MIPSKGKSLQRPLRGGRDYVRRCIVTRAGERWKTRGEKTSLAGSPFCLVCEVLPQVDATVQSTTEFLQKFSWTGKL